MRHSFVVTCVLMLALGGLSGCADSDTLELGLPTDWSTNSFDRWWLTASDTSGTYPNLESLNAMGIEAETVVYDGTTPLTGQVRVSEDRLIRYVKQSLLPLFRNRPEVVDSLFELRVAPKIRESGSSTDPGGDVARFKREGYRIIYRHFREPRTLLRVGDDIPVSIPDSLAILGSGRAVSFQVFIDESGAPQSVLLLSGVHPVLDRIALLATLQMRWQPAYLLKGRKSLPISSWARFRIRFP